jgi:hypothetical protein
LLATQNGALAAMVAPYLSGLLITQSDLGHPVGAVLPNRSTSPFRNLSQNLACGASSGICTRCAVPYSRLRWHLE